ncbi:MAG: IS200/IS605 family element transposase accessory protein TnpB [Caldilineaceae bacterium]|nr:IS200/IS605 family element transposase accessory protein TnpB [Caldilineaceae bacterium]
MRDERHTLPAEMGMLNATALQQMLRRVDKAYRAFYQGQRGAPRFKSIAYRHGDGCQLAGNHLYLQHVGNLRVKLHRPIPDDATIKQVVIKRGVGKWYVCLELALPDPEPVVHRGPAVGVDVGLHSLLALSDGTLIDNPRWLRGSLAKLRTAQRRLSRRKKYGSGWRKAARQVAKLQAHVANQRRDFWHKTTTDLARKYSLIAVEDLKLSFMTRNGNLSLSAHDASLGMFRRMLDYKVENTGSQVVGVSPRNTSQACSGCGVIVAKSLNVRVHRCPDCGVELDRDVNAARNILALGLSVRASTYPVGDCVALEAPPL